MKLGNVMIFGDSYSTYEGYFLKGMVEQSRNVSLNSEDNQAALILKTWKGTNMISLVNQTYSKKLSKELESYIQIKL